MVPPTSPNDPVFWLHHCYVDKLWADWQAMHPNEEPYLPPSGAAPGHNLTDRMPPWNEKRPADVLNTWDLGYHYDNDNYLMPNDVLYPGQSIGSASRRFSLAYSASDKNNLVLNSSNWSHPLWLSTNGQLSDGWCVMQGDGNLVIYDWSNNPLWASNTDYGYWIYLTVEDATAERGGHLQMYKWSDGTPIPWSVPPPEVGNPPNPYYLLPGEELYPGQWITSASNTYILWCWSDRCGVSLNVVGGQSQPWAAPTNPLGPAGTACRLMLRYDGNLILYDPARGPNNPTWQLFPGGGTRGNLDRMRVLDNGHLALYDTANNQVWSRPPPSAG
jgi:hypothetical protein